MVFGALGLGGGSAAQANRGSAKSLVDVVSHLEGNLVLDKPNEDWWAVFRLANIDYELLSEERKERHFKALENAIISLQDNQRVKILSLVKDFNRESYIQRRKMDNPESAKWHDLCDFYADRLRNQAPYEREIWLTVRLTKRRSSAEDFAETFFRGLERGARRARHMPVTFDERDIEWAYEEATRIESRFAPLLAEGPSRRAAPADVARLVMRGPFRAVGEEPEILEGWEPHVYVDREKHGDIVHEYYTPDEAELENVFGDVDWEADLGSLRFYHGDGRVSYQRYLKVAKMPAEGLYFPSGEWAFLNWPVDVLLDFDVEPAEKAERGRKGKARKLDQQAQHVADAGGDLGVKLREGFRLNRVLENHLAQNKPLIQCHAVLGVAAPDKKNLELMTQKVGQHYRELHVTLRRPRGNQIECFSDLLPVGGRKCTDYRQPMGTATLAGSMPIGDSYLGDGGPYLGYTRQSGAVVGWAPEFPLSEEGGNQSGATAFVGDLGSGKSVSAMYKMGTEGIRGHQSLIMDPKGDWRKMRNVEEFAEMLREIRIAPNSPTRLPILRIYDLDQIEETYTLLMSTLSAILDAKEYPDRLDAIRFAVTDFITKFENKEGELKISGLLDSFTQLKSRQNEDRAMRSAAGRCLKLLEIFMRHGVAKLILSDEAEEGDVLSEERSTYPITVIQTDGLALPTREQVQHNDMGEDERIAQATQTVVAASALQMASRHRMSDFKPVKLLVFDEAWRLLWNPAGARLSGYVTREGRSQHVVPIFATQNWSDLEGIKSHLRIKFLGRSRDTEDIEAALTDANIGPDQDIIDMVTEFENGNFIFCDHRGNAGPMYVDVVPNRWLKKLSSTPKGRPQGHLNDGKEAALAGAAS